MAKSQYTCAYCGTTFWDYPSNRTKSKSGKFFCSRACKGKARTQAAIDRAPTKSMSTCTTCGQTKPVSEFYADSHCRANGGIQYNCKECTLKARKRYYDQHQDEINARVRAYQRANPGRKGWQEKTHRAHGLLNRAVQRGKVKKPDRCQLCGESGRLHGHHWKGYAHPLDVIWLCPSCHHAAHGRGPKIRRLAESKGSPPIDWETVWCMEKPEQAALWTS